MTKATGVQQLIEPSAVFLGNSRFILRPRVEHIIAGVEQSDLIKPALVLPAWNLQDRISAERVQGALSRFKELDDVYCSEFAAQGTLILVHHTPEPTALDDHVKAYLESSFGGSYIHQKVDQKEGWIEGPYFLRGSELHQAWRLYEDDLEAFVSTTLPSESDPYRFEPLRVKSFDGRFTAVAVPSRLYFPLTAQKPLNGMRVAVKDNYHIAGTITTLGSRSFANCYGIQNKTSLYLENLINQGAIIVGKTKLCSFAGAELPPAGTIDYLAPFNPRGDGYQSPSGSSSGSGAAIAGYDWLDLALGTDTTGSTRAPAASHGVWGLRTTWESSLMTNIVPSAQSFDTLGLLSRSAEGLTKLVPSGNPAPELASRPKTLVYPTDWFPVGHEVQQGLSETFVSNLEDLLEVKRTEISLCEKWQQTAPEDVRETALPDYLRKTGWRINMWGGYHNFEEYRELYQEKFNKPPYTSPYQRWKWYDGTTVTPELLEEAEKQASVFKAWISEHIIKPDGSTIMVVPSGAHNPEYRDEGYPNPTGGSTPGGSYNTMFFATILSLPHVVIPVGQLPYESKITKRTEYLPVTIGLVGAADSDTALVTVAKNTVEKMGVPTEVQAGSLTFRLHEAGTLNGSIPNLDSNL